TIDLVPNGVKAVQMLDSEPYDLVICDIVMEPFNGLQLLAAIRAGVTQADQNLPVIMLTGHTDEKMVKAAKLLAANGFLAKPMSWNGLSNEVERVIADKTPLEIPPLNRDEVLRGLVQAQTKCADDEEELHYIGHIYKAKAPGEKADKALANEDDASPSAGYGFRSIDDVIVGEILAADVIASDGRKMLSKGIQLTKAKVKLLRSHGREYGITHLRVSAI
ncbi:MAG: response regulator, partial [Alphaproteobacteria bacterium]